MSLTFLIVEPDPLISDDLTQILTGAYPGSRVVTALTSGNAELKLVGEDSIDIAFLHVTSGALPSDDLIKTLSGLNAHVIVLNGQGVAWTRRSVDWQFVPVPFSSGMIEEAIKRSLNDAAEMN